MPSSIVHWNDAEEAEEDVLREDVVEERRGSPSARAGRSRARSRSRAPRSRCRTRRADDDDEEDRRGVVLGRLACVRGDRSSRCALWTFLPSSWSAPRHQNGHRLLLPAEDEGEHEADDRRLEEHDRRAGAVADLDLPVARHEQARAGRTRRRRRGAGRRAPPARCRPRGGPSTSAGRRGSALLHELAAPLARRREPARVLRGTFGSRALHRLVDGALAHVRACRTCRAGCRCRSARRCCRTGSRSSGSPKKR